VFSRADADLVARDERLPGLRLLLDPAALGEALQRVRPGLRINSVTYHYVRYKPGTNCLSAFTLNLDGAEVRGYAKAYQPEDWAKLMKATERHGVEGPLGDGRLVLEDEATEVVVFPNDNKLTSLSSLFDAAAGANLLARVFRDRPDLQSGTVQFLRYKPERRFVARLDVDGEPRAVLKLYSQRAYEEARITARKLGASARLIGHSAHHGVLAFEWRDGVLLSAIVNGPFAPVTVLDRTGAAIAAFHRLDGRGLRVRDRASELRTIQAIADGLRYIHPAAERLVNDLTESLMSCFRDAPAVLHPIHGDFYDRQVLVNDGQITILDLDEAVLADPAADHGLFIAHLERDALLGGVPAERVAVAREALLAGYGLPPERVELYTAFGLLQLAPHHFRSREPNWPERTEATLERALSIVAGRAVSVV
jgi:hypothetical protein